MHAIPLNALIKNTRLRRSIRTSRRPDVGRATSLMKCHCLIRSPRYQLVPRYWRSRAAWAPLPNEPVITLIAETPRKEDGVGKHDLNSLVLRRPEMSTRKRRNRSLGLYGLPCDFAMQDRRNSLRIRARLMFAMRLYSITRQCAPTQL